MYQVICYFWLSCSCLLAPYPRDPQPDFHLTSYFGVLTSDENHTVKVEELTANTSAAKAGIRVGDIVVSFNNITVTSTDQFRDLIKNSRSGKKVEMIILRGKEKIKITTILLARLEF